MVRESAKRTTGEGGGAWTASEGGRDHVKRLIAESGVPLEAMLSRMCRRFASVFDGTEGLRITTDPLVYGFDQDRPLREVDQLVTFYQEIPVGDRLGVQLILNVPIEAKARRGVEFFGLEVSGQDVGRGALPIAGELAFSDVVRNQVAAHLPAHMTAQRVQRVAALKFKDDGSPQSVHDEKFVYNSAASLYDFVMESAAPDELSPTTIVNSVEADPKMASIVGEFEKYASTNHYLPEHVARPWARSLSHDRIREYVDHKTGGRRVFRMLDIYCPVVCVDCPIYLVEMDGAGDIASFASADALVTAVRIAGWQSEPGRRLSRRGPEAITSLMTLAGVEALLPDLAQLFGEVRDSLEQLTSEAADRAVFEHDFIKAVSQGIDRSATYRSDLDFGDF